MDDVPDYVISGLALAFLPVTLVAGLGLGAYQVGKVTSNEAKSWRKKSDYKSAEKALVKYIHTKTELIEANPKDAQAHLKRAMAFVLREDWAAAIADFWACIRLTPEDCRPYFDLALVYLVVNDRKAAERMYAAAMDHLGPHTPKRMMMSGVDLPKKKAEAFLGPKKQNKGNIKKEKSKKHDRPHFDFFELYQLRASNLYQLGIQPENNPQEQKELLDKALGLIKKAAEVYDTSKYQTDRKKGHLLNDMAIITYHQAFNPATCRTYTHTIWKLVRLVLLGIQDPGSSFFMFKDLDFIWHFLIRDFDPVMKNCGYLDFPGFSTLDPYIFTQIELVNKYLQEIDTLGATNAVTEEYRHRCLYFLNRTKEKNPEPLNPFKLPIVDRLHPDCWDVKSFLPDWVGSIPCTFATTKERWHYPTTHTPEWQGPVYDFKLSLEDGYSVASNTLQFFNAGWDSKHGNFCLTCQDISYPEGTYEYDFTRIGTEGDLYRGTISVVHENLDGVLPGSSCRCRATIKPKEIPLQAVHKWIVSLTKPKLLPYRGQLNNVDPQVKLENAQQNHSWSPIQLKRPKWCDQCKYHIKSWGLTTHLKCDVCHMLVHKTCAQHVVCTCYQKPSRASLL